MRRKLTGLIVCLIASAMLLSACSGNRLIKQIGSVIQDQATGTRQDDQSERQNESASTTGRDVLNTSVGLNISFDGEELDWPNWIPDGIPQYKYGKLISAIQMGDDEQSNQYGHLMFTDIRSAEEAFSDYVNDLERSGWVKEEGWVYQDKEIQTINMMHTDYYLIYSCGEDEDGSFASIHFSQEDSSGNDPSGQEDEDEKDTITVTNEGVEGLFSNEAIPDDYPHDLCPIFEPSSLLAVQRIADDDLTVFVLMLLSKEDEATVSEFYNQQKPSFVMGSSTMAFESEDGETTASVQIGPAEEEHTAQGYQTIIMITAGIENES